jgi:hypothetical protein
LAFSARVDAINDDAASLYRYGFVPLADEPLTLFVPVTGGIGEPASRDDAARRGHRAKRFTSAVRQLATQGMSMIAARAS